MKKGIIIFTSIFLLMLVTSLVITACNSNKEEYVLSVKEGYSVTFDDEAIVEIPLYFSNENIYNTHSSISSVYISNEVSKIICELKAIEEVGMADYQGKEYHQFNYSLLIPCQNDLFIDNALLNIVAGDKTLGIEVGTVSLRYVEDLGEPKDITINSSQVLAKSGTIEGILIEIVSKSEEDIKITNIEVDGNKVFVDLNNITHVYKTYTEQNSINDLIDGYNLYTKQPNFSLGEFVIKGSVNVVLPIKYLDKLIFTSSPIIINYEINGISDRYVLDDIKYIKHINRIVDIGGVVKCQL